MRTMAGSRSAAIEAPAAGLPANARLLARAQDSGPTPTLLLGIAPIYLVAAAVLAGDMLGVCGVAAPLWVAVGLAVATAALFMRRVAGPANVVALLAIGAAASTAAWQVVAPGASALSLRNFPDHAIVTVEGRIDRAPLRFPDREYVFVDVERVGLRAAAMRPARGTIRITVVGGSAGVRVGDQVRVTSALRFPRNFGDPGEFDYAGYLARQGIVATMVLRSGAALPEIIGYRREFPASEIAAMRGHIGAFIDANLHGEQRAEMRALVIGDRGGISRALRNRFALSGLAHILVISGLHLGFVAAVVFGLVRLVMGPFAALVARGWANKVAAVCAAAAAAFYAALAGGHVSTVRALVMVVAYALAVVVDRPREVLASLALAAIVICLAMPGSTADIGFQLSFVSVLAIVLGMRRFTAWWRRRMDAGAAVYGGAGGAARRRIVRVGAFVAGYVAVSFWALVGVAPLTAYHFNQFSTVGVIANSVVVPVMALGGVVCGLAACAIGLIAPVLGRPLLHVAGWSLAAGTSLAGWFVRWPCAYFRIFTPTPIEVVIAYGFLMVWLTAGAGRGRRPDAGGPGSTARGASHGARRIGWRAVCLAILAVALAADAGWWTYHRWFDPDLRVTFLSVGQGDSEVVRFGGGRVMLIDAGGAWPDGFDFGERIVARYLWGEKIMHVDYMVMSHPDIDHFGGLGFVARNFSPGEFWTTGASSRDESYAALMREIAARRIPVRIVNSSTAPLTVGGATIRCLSPVPGQMAAKDNNLSMVLRIAQGRQSVLFTGDIEAKAERVLVDRFSGLSSTVLKVPHHGSRTSSTAPFVAAVHPRVAVMSVGYRNRFHFPAAVVVRRYRAEKARVLRTDQVGAVGVDLGRRPITLWTYRDSRAGGAPR